MADGNRALDTAVAAAALLEVRRRRHAAAKLYLQGTRPRDRKSRGAFPEHTRLQIQARLAFIAREALESLSIGVEDVHAASNGQIDEWETDPMGYAARTRFSPW